MSDATRTRLADGRWHLQHGPIDLVVGADGEARAVERAHEALWERFPAILPRLVEELPRLRTEVPRCGPLEGPVARRMLAAVWPHRGQFITHMAAVAGAVADELIAPYRDEPAVERAHVNDGGDIALHLRTGASYRVGLFADLGRIEREGWGALGRLDGDFAVHHDTRVRGVATSGWRGRSFSRGIADSVTVLGADAAAADAAATVVANALDVADPRVLRRPARELDPDSDLGDRLVTVDVPLLEPALVEAALDAGAAEARRLRRGGLLWGAVLVLQGRCRVVTGRRPGLAAAGRGKGEALARRERP